MVFIIITKNLLNNYMAGINLPALLLDTTSISDDYPMVDAMTDD